MRIFALLIVLLFISIFAYAANVPTPNLPSGGNLQSTDTIVTNRAGSTVQTSPSVLFPAGSPGALQISTTSGWGALSINTSASYAAHDIIMNGLAYDPRNYGAMCQGVNIFAGDGSTKTFTYTIPFTGGYSTDNSNFFVFYEATNGSGTATILNSTQFTVTGVNSGSGGTITFNSAPPASNTILLYHDDGPALTSASTAAVASGGYVSLPDNCTIYTSQASGTQLADGTNLIGQNFDPNYSFGDLSTKPILYVIAPSNLAPAAGINYTSKAKQYFAGFEITSKVPTASTSLGFQQVPVMLGVTTTAGAGGGELPGILADHIAFDYGLVGYGAPSALWGTSAYIFASVRNSTFSSDNVGAGGPFSDFQFSSNDFNSDGEFGSYGSAGDIVLTAGMCGAFSCPSGAGFINQNRFEFSKEGIVTTSASTITIGENQFDALYGCGVDLRGTWNAINITGGWFRGNANGGGSFVGNTTAGQDADICLNSSSSVSGDLHVSNVNFITNYGEGSTAALGSAGATTPPYVLDVVTTGSFNNNVSFDGGSMWFSNTTTGGNSSVTDTAIYRNGRPSNLTFNVMGQTVQGKVANGQNPSQARGLPANKWSAYYVVGQVESVNNQNAPLTAAYPSIVAKNIGIAPTWFITNDFSHFDCDVVQTNIVPNINPNVQDNAVVTWLPGSSDVTYGAGTFANHLADTNTCRLGGLTWMALPKKSKIYAQAGCTPTGSWTNSASYTGYYGLTSNTNGDTLACPITTHGGPVYLWYQMDTTSNGTFTWQLDSTTTGAVTIKGSNALGTGTKSLGAVRIPVNSAASHTINVTLTSTTTAANTVTIEGLGTTSGTSWHGSSPSVFLGGQINGNATNYPSAQAAFNQAEKDQAAQLFGDGLSIGFADVQSYINTSSDYFSNNKINANGQAHLADAFSAVMQYIPVDMGTINPLNYGASCNTQLFTGIYNASQQSHLLTTTSGSNVISISNYTFQPGTATQNGGGDVGKVISPSCRSVDVGPTTYIASVTTATNTATIGYNALASCAASGYAVMGGYPTNPNDPSTAQDDTAALTAATHAAVGVPSSLSSNTQTVVNNGGKVWMPNNCLVHNFTPANDVEIEGNNGGHPYTSAASSQFNVYGVIPTRLFVASGGFAEDNAYGINLSGTTHVALKNFSVEGPIFPAFSGDYTACVGSTTPAGDLDTEDFLLDHMSMMGCSVGFGIPFLLNKPVTFTASIVPDIDGVHGDMTVTAITSDNVAAYSPTIATDWLALGRTVSGAGVTSNTTITTAAPMGGTGAYIVSLSQTVTSEAMTSPAASTVQAGSSRFTWTGANRIGFNGDFSDWSSTDDVFTGDFISGWWMGPNTSGSGNGANRILGGRFEETANDDQHGGNNVYGGAFVCDGCGYTQLNGVQFQYNQNHAIGVNGGFEFLVNGAMIQGNGAANANVQDRSQVALAGAWSNVSFNGNEWYEAHSGGGSTSNYLIETTTGSSGDFLSLNGGNARFGFATAPLSFVGNTPVHYDVDVAGLTKLDSNIIPHTAGLALTSTAGGIYSETGLTSTTTTAGTFSLTTLTAAPTSWNCQGGDLTLGNTWPMTATTSTSCSLSATTTNGDSVWWQGTAH